MRQPAIFTEHISADDIKEPMTSDRKCNPTFQALICFDCIGVLHITVIAQPQRPKTVKEAERRREGAGRQKSSIGMCLWRRDLVTVKAEFITAP
jgi:hypothetical protein